MYASQRISFFPGAILQLACRCADIPQNLSSAPELSQMVVQRGGQACVGALKLASETGMSGQIRGGKFKRERVNNPDLSPRGCYQ